MHDSAVPKVTANCDSLSGGAAGEDQASLHGPTGEMSPTRHQIDQAGTDMHGRPLSTDGGSGVDANHEQKGFAYGNPPRKHMASEGVFRVDIE